MQLASSIFDMNKNDIKMTKLSNTKITKMQMTNFRKLTKVIFFKYSKNFIISLENKN